METLSWILMFFTVGYGVLVALFFIGWKRLPGAGRSSTAYARLTVVVAARNEAQKIRMCLESLASQDYPHGYLEVIVVNDHSSDQTSSIIQDFITSRKLSHFRLINLTDPAGKSGKKHAISLAADQAQGEYIITTDADCQAGTQWLATINRWIQAYDPAMLIGPVVLTPAASLFEKMQVLEFCSLSGTTGGAAGLHHPVMCNGANLVFRKNDFQEVGGYQGNMNYASGDDVFLLHKFFEARKGTILFMKDRQAMVQTAPVPTIKAFFKQRIRWASKSTGYKDWFTLLVAALVAMVNLLLAVALVMALLAPHHSPGVLPHAWLLKALVEFPLLWMVTGFYGKRPLMWIFPLVFLVYPFYVVASAMFSFAGPQAKPWK